MPNDDARRFDDRVATTAAETAAVFEAVTVRDRSPVPMRYVRVAVAIMATIVIAIAASNVLPSGERPDARGLGHRRVPLAASPVTPPPPTTHPGGAPVRHVIVTPQARVSLTIPADWRVGEGSAYLPPAIGRSTPLDVAVSPEVSYVVADVCAFESSVEFISVGPTVADLTAAFLDQAGIRRSDPTSVVLGRFQATRFDLSLDRACVGLDGHGIWADATRTHGLWLRRGETATVSVIDMDGDPLVLMSRHGPQASRDDIAQLDAVTASITIEPVPDVE